MNVMSERCFLSATACMVIALSGCGKSQDAVKASTEAPPPTNIVAEAAPNSPPPVAGAADGLVDKYMKDQTYKEKSSTLFSLRRLNSDEALMSLATLFSIETDDDLRVDILDTMSHIKSTNTAWAITPALDAAYVTEVRLAAIEALEDADQTNAIPSLLALVTDPNPAIRKAAAHAIDWLQTPTVPPEQLRQLFIRMQQRKLNQQNKNGG